MTYTIYNPATMKPLAVGLTALEAAMTLTDGKPCGCLSPEEIISLECGPLIAVYDKDWPVLLQEWRNRT